MNRTNDVSNDVPSDIPQSLKGENRKELIEYYKWIVGLCTFVLTVSASLSAIPGTQVNRYFCAAGWLALSLCIVINWLLIKKLVSIPIVTESAEIAPSLLINTFLKSIEKMKVYGFVQNGLFLLGGFMLLLSYLAPYIAEMPFVQKLSQLHDLGKWLGWMISISGVLALSSTLSDAANSRKRRLRVPIWFLMLEFVGVFLVMLTFLGFCAGIYLTADTLIR